MSLRSKGFGSDADAACVEKDEHSALSNMLTCQSSGLGITRAAIRLAALDWIRRQRATLTLPKHLRARPGRPPPQNPFGLKN